MDYTILYNPWVLGNFHPWVWVVDCMSLWWNVISPCSWGIKYFWITEEKCIKLSSDWCSQYLIVHDGHMIPGTHLLLACLWFLGLLGLCICLLLLLTGDSLSPTSSIIHQCNCPSISGYNATAYLSTGLLGSSLLELFELSGVAGLFLLVNLRCFINDV